MNFNLTVNESGGALSVTPGVYNVRAYYTETDAGHIFGPYSTLEAAENCATVLAGRSGVIRVTIEKVS